MVDRRRMGHIGDVSVSAYCRFFKHRFLCCMLVLLVYLLGSDVCAQPVRPAAQESYRPPKLIVGLVVDQMRWDYLYRYYDRYGEDGFKRMIRKGFSFENAYINYLPSSTGVGHASIFTGSVPSIHGIAGNNWIDRYTGRKWYCTEDTAEQTVGSTSTAGRMSPRNLLVSTITDELQIASNFQSKVVGISLKDRGAILPAGHTGTAAFWWDNKARGFITSTYYMEQLPDWVEQFNNMNYDQTLLAEGWETLYPLDTYINSTADDAPWEGPIAGKSPAIFPYERVNIRQSPFGNTLTLRFAEEAVDGYGLGQNKATDFLTLNLASTDYVGHATGPNSIETEDTYLRLDRDLASFFAFLDEEIGSENYLVFLTADHGGAHSLGYMEKYNLPTGIWDTDLVKRLNEVLLKETGVNQLVNPDLDVAINYQINYDRDKIKQHALDVDTINKTSVNFLQRQPGIMYAVDVTRIGTAPIPRRIKEMIINGYNYKRSGTVQIIPEPGWMPEYSRQGTTHGGWNPYDTHIPLLFMGWDISHGRSSEMVYITDIAPTLATLLRIQAPNGSIGSPLKAITRMVNN